MGDRVRGELKGGEEGKERKRQRVIKTGRRRWGRWRKREDTMQSGTGDGEEEKRHKEMLKAKNESL